MLQVATGRGPRISRPRSSACGNSLLIRIESSIIKKGPALGETQGDTECAAGVLFLGNRSIDACV